MAELYHIGLMAAHVSPRVLLIEEGIDAVALVEPHTLVPLAARREYTTFQGHDEFGPFLVCQTGIGSPQLAIAVEEFARAGAQCLVAVLSCQCPACLDEAADAHAIVVPFGAARLEGTTVQYAPTAFPAVPDPTLLDALRTTLPDAASLVTQTVDVPHTWFAAPANALGAEHGARESGSGPVDLGAATLFVVAAARQVAGAAVIIGRTRQPAPLRLGALVLAAAGAIHGDSR